MQYPCHYQKQGLSSLFWKAVERPNDRGTRGSATATSGAIALRRVELWRDPLCPRLPGHPGEGDRIRGSEGEGDQLVVQLEVQWAEDVSKK